MTEFDQDPDIRIQDKITQIRIDAIRRCSRDLGMILGADKDDIRQAILSVLSEAERRLLQGMDQT
jgi:hypothetical protein